MRILITAAEQEELDCAIKAYEALAPELGGRVEADFTLTAIGTTSTAYRVTREIVKAEAQGKGYSLAINIGIAGSYDLQRYPMGSAAVISKEYFGDLGFETFEGFKTLFQYGILESNDFPYRDEGLVRPPLPYEKLERVLAGYRDAVGVTVQTVTGDPVKVKEMYERFTPGIESMEGAAFYFVALQEGVPCVEVRTVSNLVGERDRGKWDIPAALEALFECCKDILSAL